MYIIKVTHDRCDEYDKTTFYVSNIVSRYEALSILDRAQKEYMEFVKTNVTNTRPEQPSADLSSYPPEMTIGELQKKKREWKDQFDAWQASKQNTENFFKNYLANFGIFPVEEYDGDDIVDHYLNWGHNHGVTFYY